MSHTTRNNLEKSFETLLREKEQMEKDIKDVVLDNESENWIDRELSKKAEKLFNEGVYSLKEKDFIEALGLFRAVLVLEPLNFKAMNNLALTMHYLGFKEKAVFVLKELLKMQPEHKTAVENIRIIEDEIENDKE